MRIMIAALIVSALLTQVSYAQRNTIPASVPPSAEENAEMARKKADEMATDKDYKSTLQRMPDAHQKVDPWGGLRTPPATGKN